MEHRDQFGCVLMVRNDLTSLFMISKFKKQMLMVLLALVPIVSLSAATPKEYVVYNVVGKAYLVDGKKKVDILANMRLTPSSLIQIEDESAVTVLDEKNCKMFSFSKKGTDTVSKLVNAAKNKSKNLSKLYVEYLLKELTTSSTRRTKQGPRINRWKIRTSNGMHLSCLTA